MGSNFFPRYYSNVSFRGDNTLAIKPMSAKLCDKPTSFIVHSYHTNEFCPVFTLKQYVKYRPKVQDSNLFLNEKGLPFRRDFLAKKLKTCIHLIGGDASDFNTHSFRVGRATDLALAGTPHGLIKTAGRWNNEAYLSI